MIKKSVIHVGSDGRLKLSNKKESFKRPGKSSSLNKKKHDEKFLFSFPPCQKLLLN